jgi:hypothetical protein
MTDTTHTPQAVGHEPGDENIRTILITAGILVAVGIATFLIAWGMLEFFRDRESAEKRSVFPLALEENQLSIDQRLRRMPRSQPVLEGLKLQEGDSIDQQPEGRQAWKQPSLEDYGPGDEKGFARIPIDVAIDRMLAKDRFPVQGPKKP